MSKPLDREERGRLIRQSDAVMASPTVASPCEEIAAWNVRRYEATVAALEAALDAIAERAAVIDDRATESARSEMAHIEYLARSALEEGT